MGMFQQLPSLLSEARSTLSVFWHQIIRFATKRNYSKSRKEEIVANPFVHVELNTADPIKAKAFYSKLFEWQLEDMPNSAVPNGNYTIIKVGEGTGGGLMQQVPGGPSGWLSYVGVDDVRAATTKAQSLGGEVMKDVTEVSDMGWFSFIKDPTGAVLGLWQSKSK